MKIWVLLSIDNDYNQPPNNLVAWWIDKPTFIELAGTLHIKVNSKKGNADIGKLLKGNEQEIYFVNYRLENIIEGELKN